MTAIADLVAVLLSTGIPPELIARAVDLAQQHAIEQVEIHRNSTGIPPETALDKRRKWDRERKRNSPKGALTTLPSSSVADSQGRKEEVVGRAARGTRLHQDWRPAQVELNFAVCHMAEGRIAQEIEKFRDYWHARAGPGGVKLDWSATWRTWIRKAAENGKPNGKSNPTMDAFDDLIARTGGTVEGDPPMRDVTPRGGHSG